MARLKYNGLSATLGASLTNTATSITFGAALTHSNGTAVPTLVAGDYIPLVILDSNGHMSEVVWLTAYTAGQTTGTIARGKEGTSGVAHSSGDKVIGSILVADISQHALTPGSLHPTYGDHFAAGSLDAKWTRVGYVAGDEQYPKGGGGWLQIDTARTAGNYYYQAAPSGDFTVVMKASVLSAGNIMFGPMILDSSGNGVQCAVYSSTEGYYAFKVTGGTYGSVSVTVGGLLSTVTWSGREVWYRLRKSGDNYYASISLNGHTWFRETSAMNYVITPARIGFGCIFQTPVAFAVDFFDVQ